MGRTGHASPHRPARRAGVLALCALLAGCGREDTLRTERRIPLPPEARGGATLALDSAGTLWVGVPGRLVAVDSAGAPGPDVPLGGDTLPRLLWRDGERVMLALPGRVAAAPAEGGGEVAAWGSPRLREVVRDPRGRWAFAVLDGSGVVGLDAETLVPRWGWPETGGDPVAAAASPLGDRLYVAVGAEEGRPSALQVRDAASGRLLHVTPHDPALRALAVGGNGAVFAAASGSVFRLAQGERGMRRVWARPVGVRGEEETGVELRVDGAGRRVAVFGRSEGGRLVLLDGGTGAVLGETAAAPRDAAFGPGGRLYLLEEDAVRVVR